MGVLSADSWVTPPTPPLRLPLTLPHPPPAAPRWTACGSYNKPQLQQQPQIGCYGDDAHQLQAGMGLQSNGNGSANALMTAALRRWSHSKLVDDSSHCNANPGLGELRVSNWMLANLLAAQPDAFRDPGMDLIPAPAFSQLQLQLQLQMEAAAGPAGGQQHLGEHDIAHLLHLAPCSGAMATGASPSLFTTSGSAAPPAATATFPTHSAGQERDSVAMLPAPSTPGSNVAAVMHWADHIHVKDLRSRSGSRGGREEVEAESDAPAPLAAVDGLPDIPFHLDDFCVQHWLKEPELDPGPGPGSDPDLLLDFLHSSAPSLRRDNNFAIDSQDHDCKLIGIQDYLPDLDCSHHDVAPAVMDKGSACCNSDANVDTAPSRRSSSQDPDPEVLSASMCHLDALPTVLTDLASASVSDFNLPAGASLSRTSSSMKLTRSGSNLDISTTTAGPPDSSPTTPAASDGADKPPPAAATAQAKLPLGAPRSPGRRTGENTTSVLASPPAAPRSRRCARGSATSCNRETVSGQSPAPAVLSPASTLPAGDGSKRKSSAVASGTQQKRSKKSAAACDTPGAAPPTPCTGNSKQPSLRRQPARTSPQAASRNLKRSRQSEEQSSPDSAQGSAQDATAAKKPSTRASQSGLLQPKTPTGSRKRSAAKSDPHTTPSKPSKKPRKESKREAAARASNEGTAEAMEESDKLPPSSERESHVIAERRRRRSMNCMLSTLGSLLPPDGNNPKPTDRLKVVAQTITYIQEMQQSMKTLTHKKAELTVAQSLLHSTRHVLAASGVHKVAKKLTFGTKSNTAVATSSSPQDSISLHLSSGQANNGGSSCDGIKPHSTSPVLTLDIFGMEAFITLSCPRARPDFFWKTLLLLDQLRFKVVTAQKSTNERMAYHSIHVKNKEDEENKNLKSALEGLMTSMSL